MGTQLQWTILNFNTALNKAHQGMAGFSYSSSAIPDILLTRLSWVVRTMQLPQLPLSYCLQSWKPYNRKLLILPDSKSQRRKTKLWLARCILGSDHLSLPNSRSSAFLFCLISMEVVCRTQRTGSYDMIMGCIAVPPPPKKGGWAGGAYFLSSIYIMCVCISVQTISWFSQLSERKILLLACIC